MGRSQGTPARRSVWWRCKRALLRTRPGLALRVLLKGAPSPPPAVERTRPNPVAPPVEPPSAAPSAPALVRPAPAVEEPRLAREPLPQDETWPEPPQAPAEPTPSVGGFREGADARPRFDIKLFEQLNEEYARAPLVPVPRGLDPAARMDGARRRLSRVRAYVQLDGMRVLELGCGQGQEVWLLHHKFGCEAHGIDIASYPQWSSYGGAGVSFLQADGARMPYADDSFDRIVSFAVWEHIPHPYRALSEARRILRPGGIMWLYANLHRGPSASHRYRDVYFPWPHLLFDESVMDEFYERRGKPARGYSWVNRLTYDTYAKYFRLLDLRLLHLQFSERWDQAFYERFASVLSRYPLTDLKRDFFTAILQKPG